MSHAFTPLAVPAATRSGEGSAFHPNVIVQVNRPPAFIAFKPAPRAAPEPPPLSQDALVFSPSVFHSWLSVEALLHGRFPAGLPRSETDGMRAIKCVADHRKVRPKNQSANSSQILTAKAGLEAGAPSTASLRLS